MELKVHLVTRSDDLELVALGEDSTVKQVKLVCAERFADPSILNWFLVWAGFVRSEDSGTLREMGMSNGETVCLIPSSSSILENEGESQEWIRKIVNLRYHFAPSDDQKGASSLVPILKAFCTSLQGNSKTSPWIPSLEDVVILSKAVQVLENKTLTEQTPHVTWFEEYGCALLSNIYNIDQVRLNLVCLDSWSFEIHSAEARREHTARADSHAPVSLYVGSVDQAAFSLFLGETKTRLAKAKNRKREDRSAAGGKQGHQKTPAMIQALMVDSLRLDEACNEEAPIQPRGGFTDVGRHTGGQKRNVSWPLVLAVFQTVVEAEGRVDLFLRFVPQMYLRISEGAVADILQQVQRLAANGCTQTRTEFNILVDSAMQALTTAADEATDLIKHCHWESETRAIEVRCIRLRHELDLAVQLCADVHASRYRLSPFSKQDLHLTNPRLVIPPEAVEETDDDNLAALRERAQKNLGWLPAPTEVTCTPNAMLRWLAHPRFKSISDEPAYLFVCKTVETFFFSGMLRGLKVHSHENLAAVEQILDYYRGVLQKLCSTKEACGLLQEELKSKEVLVVWITFCMLHHSTKATESLVGEYSVPLDSRVLRHLVLSERIAVEAAQQVVRYIKNNTSDAASIFSLLPADETIEFARRYSSDSLPILWALGEESRAAEQRKKDHWAQVCYQKEKLVLLDRELSSIQSSLRRARNESDMCSPPFRSLKAERRYSEANRNIATLVKEENRKTKEIAHMEKPPRAILQPLPCEKQNALPILFFMFMPKNFQMLSRLSFLAQQILLPRKGEVEISLSPDTSGTYSIRKSVQRKAPTTNWRDYYMLTSTDRSYCAVKTEVVLGSDHSHPQGEDWHPNSVRKYCSSSDGVWYPDILKPSLHWDGGSFSLDSRTFWFDPFAELLTFVIAENFTAKLGAERSEMQWALSTQHQDNHLTRGNVAEAFQDAKPAWLQWKQQFLCFGSLRAHPHQQLRKLCVALSERSLPLEDCSVRLMLQQTLYQVGEIEISSDDHAKCKRRADFENFNGWAALHHSLETLVEEHRSKVRDHEVLATIAEVADYASQWDSSCRFVSRKLCQIVRSWADKLGFEQASADIGKAAEIRARRCLLYMCCLSCHAYGEITSEDAAAICEALLMANYTRLFDDPTSLDADVRRISVKTSAIIVRRLPNLLCFVNDQEK